MLSSMADGCWRQQKLKHSGNMLIENSEFQKQVDRVCISYIPHFGISATLIIMELRDYRTSLMIDLNTEDGENFAMMVAMGFFTWSASRYEMTIPPI